MVPHWRGEGDRILEAWFHQARRRESAGFQGGLREGGPRVLVLYQESGPTVFQEFAAQFQGIGCRWVPIPQTAAEEVLKAWNYTRC